MSPCLFFPHQSYALLCFFPARRDFVPDFYPLAADKNPRWESIAGLEQAKSLLEEVGAFFFGNSK